MWAVWPTFQRYMLRVIACSLVRMFNAIYTQKLTSLDTSTLKMVQHAYISNMLSIFLTFYSSGRASPSTREAIAGMLAISRAFLPDHSNSKDEMSSPRLRRKKIQFSDDYGENIDKVHQDEDYSKFLISYVKCLGEECGM
jgi:hypothetical protein